MNEEEFLKKLHEAFAQEADEHFGMIRRGLADLEQKSEDSVSVVELIFREAHSLKGAARAINRGDIESLCQQFEGLFSKWKKDPDALRDAPFELCSDAVDLLEVMLRQDQEFSLSIDPLASMLERLKTAAATNGHSSQASSSIQNRGETVSDMPLKKFASGLQHPGAVVDVPAEATFPTDTGDVDPQYHVHPQARVAKPPVVPPASPPSKALKDTVRVSIQELESLYRQAEEMSTVKFMLGRMTSDLRLIVDQCREWLREYHKHRRIALEHDASGRRAETQSSDRYEDSQTFAKWTARQIEGIETAVSQGIEDGRGTMYIMETMVDDLVDNTRRLLLLPFSIVTDAFPSMVNKLARDLGKKIDFRLHGEDVCIDKRILEELKDPLVHLLRNCIDHGIESEETRTSRGKAPVGTLRLDIGIAGDNRVELSLTDDGAGIDVEAVRGKAMSEGIASSEYLSKLSDQEVLELIFHSGLSTASTVTEVSGRGIGLAVVRENVASLGGEVTVSTQPGKGTTFRLLLPVSLSNARGVLVRTSGRMYIVPLQYIVRGMSLPKEDVEALDGQSVFEYEGRTVPLYRLEELLGMPISTTEAGVKETILVISCAGAFFGLRVEQVMWEQDVVIKPLPAPIVRVRTIVGATLLGTGELVPVLHIPDLLDVTRRSDRGLSLDSGESAEEKISRLLVVDDSITSRVLLHDILVSSGYQVKTAIDGIDALTHLRESEYDLVVSDVEMPRMNGFELTQTIRGDEKLHEIPVILVTGLESREDRERGFDVGANAYIIKSGFDQSNLLEVIGRLI